MIYGLKVREGDSEIERNINLCVCVCVLAGEETVAVRKSSSVTLFCGGLQI